MKNILKFYGESITVTILGLLAALAIGFVEGGTWAAATSTLFIVAVLAVLEVSLSFDNAVVNATELRHMDAKWRHRFLTWGILIAVFGMRIVFPLLIVAVIAGLGPIDVVNMALFNPSEYAHHMESAHIAVSAFGGAFLLMVGLKAFLDAEKEVFWIGFIERPLAKLGRLDMLQSGITMAVVYVISTYLDPAIQTQFLHAGIGGWLTYVAVDSFGALMETSHDTTGTVVRSGLATFLYLEVLDASFSFDGVIGAFAITNELLIIAIGLGIGACFVRSMTIQLVETNKLSEYRYLEHGAFYAIIALAVIMFLKTFIEVPEVITGLIGAGFIGLAFISSVLYNRANPEVEDSEEAVEVIPSASSCCEKSHSEAA